MTWENKRLDVGYAAPRQTFPEITPDLVREFEEWLERYPQLSPEEKRSVVRTLKSMSPYACDLAPELAPFADQLRRLARAMRA